MFSAEGKDTVVNATSTSAGPGAPMLAFGKQGDDVLIGDPKVKDELHGGIGADTLRGMGGGDKLVGDAGVDQLTGASGQDELYGGPDNDRLDGGDESDILDGGTGGDIIDGGEVDLFAQVPGDMVVYDRTADVQVDLRRTDASQGEANEHDTILHVERVRSGSGDDTLIGDARNNVLFGGPGRDGLAGDAGKDFLAGEDGDDVLLPSPEPNVAFPIGVVPDVMADTLSCGDDNDIALRVPSDGDVVTACESVFDM